MTFAAAPLRKYGVLVPVKARSVGKSRLAPLGDQARQRLATAFALDTVSAVLATPLVDLTVVVTEDQDVAAQARGLGALVLPDRAGGGLNSALVKAAAEVQRRHPSLSPAVVLSDLPALQPEELAQVLRAHHSGFCFVSDARGVGTTTLVAADLACFRPHFGPDSANQHRLAGGVEVHGHLPGLRQDVDTREDLDAALAIGVGQRTSAVVRDLGLTTLLDMQGTVARFDAESRTGVVFLDDGTRLSFGSAALEGTGLRHLRMGQRVKLETRPGDRSGDPVQIERVQILTLS